MKAGIASPTRRGRRSIHSARSVRAIVIGTAALIAIYLLANVAYVAALGPERSAQSERIAAEAIEAMLGPRAGQLIALVILVSIFSAANANGADRDLCVLRDGSRRHLLRANGRGSSALARRLRSPSL